MNTTFDNNLIFQIFQDQKEENGSESENMAIIRAFEFRLKRLKSLKSNPRKRHLQIMRSTFQSHA